MAGDLKGNHARAAGSRPLRPRMIALVAGSVLFQSALGGITMLDPADAPWVSMDAYRALAAGFPEVGRVQAAFVGSGVLIDPHWVLTAAHVVAFTSQPRFVLGGVAHTAAEVHVLPGFDFLTQTNDLALLRFENPIHAVAPASLWRFADPAVLLGREAVWVGYGMTGTGRTGRQSFPDGPLAMTNVIDVFGASIGVASTTFVSDFDSPGGGHNSLGFAAEPTLLEGNVAPGDSGGGVYVDTPAGYALVGVVAFAGRIGGSADSRYGDLSGATNLRLFEDWITQTSGVAFIPEPRAATLILALAITLMLFQRRQLRDRLRVPPREVD